MEVDQTYIFGSFSRRRQCDDVTAPKRRSLGHGASLQVTTSATLHPQQSSRGRLANNDSLLCPMCVCEFIEPRVLPCFHTFCTSCLVTLDSNTWSVEIDSVPHAGQPIFEKPGCSQSSTGSNSGSAQSGSENSWILEKRETEVRLLTCPLCGKENKLPAGGVTALTPHYVLQNRIVLASLNRDSTRLLCDLCSSDMTASNRCTDCHLSLCQFCAEAHSRQRITSSHEVLPLNEARSRGITSVRRQVMCPRHPEQEVHLFCASCRSVMCRECCLQAHRGHLCESVASAALGYTAGVREALHKAQPVAEQANIGLARLGHLFNRIEMRCNQVQEEVDNFIDSYIVALEEHRQNLQLQVLEARETKLHALREQEIDLQRCAEESNTVVHFAEQLLAEGSDVEILSFVSPLLRQLEICVESSNGISDHMVSECVQFLSGENAGTIKTHTLFGVVTTQLVSPQHCFLNTDGLLNCRQYKKVEALLVTCDSNEQPLCHGGKKVVAELRYRDTSHRRIPVHVTDLRNGTYLLSFFPDSSGNLTLSVTIQGKPIKGCPIRVCVRTLRPHHGKFHCCSFCSSGGAKDATCGCGSTMPGGYRGCGHGHALHPGSRHWSCCGSLLEHSECSGVYHISL